MSTRFVRRGRAGTASSSQVASFPPGLYGVYSGRHLQWVSEPRWRQCLFLSGQLEPFSLLCKSLLANVSQWNAFRDSKAAYALMGSPYSSEGAPPEESEKSPEEGKGAAGGCP